MGAISGALFAFVTSFDEVVAVLQLANVSHRKIPRYMFSGIREQISPTISAVVTILVIISILLLTTVELLRRGVKLGSRHADAQICGAVIQPL